jgi:hypothetical protein
MNTGRRPALLVVTRAAVAISKFQPSFCTCMGMRGSSQSLLSYSIYSSFFSVSGNSHQINAIQKYNAIQIGCNTYVPAFCAIIPTMKGATAPPEVPTDPINDKEAICISLGIRRWKIWIAAGDIGPRTRPANATATESPGMERTNQTMSSRIKAWVEC